MDHEPEDLVGEPVDDVDADRRARLFPAPAEALERRARSVSSPENKLNLMGAPDEEFRASFARARRPTVRPPLVDSGVDN